MTTLFSDLKYAIRQLRKNPGFTAIAILILAVAIAANTSLFSVVNAVMLRPLPYQDSHELVWIKQPSIELTERFRHRPNFSYLREHNTVFESVAGYRGNSMYIKGIESPQQVLACDVTVNLFSLLGIQPMLGRGFGPEDEKPESPRVVVVSHGFWRDHLDADPNVIGRGIDLTSMRGNTDGGLDLESGMHTVVGVMPPEFRFPFHINLQVWRAMIFTEGPVEYYESLICPIARLKKGVPLERARAELAILARHFRRTDSTEAAPLLFMYTGFWTDSCAVIGGCRCFYWGRRDVCC